MEDQKLSTTLVVCSEEPDGITLATRGGGDPVVRQRAKKTIKYIVGTLALVAIVTAAILLASFLRDPSSITSNAAAFDDPFVMVYFGLACVSTPFVFALMLLVFWGITTSRANQTVNIDTRAETITLSKAGRQTLSIPVNQIKEIWLVEEEGAANRWGPSSTVYFLEIPSKPVSLRFALAQEAPRELKDSPDCEEESCFRIATRVAELIGRPVGHRNVYRPPLGKARETIVRPLA